MSPLSPPTELFDPNKPITGLHQGTLVAGGSHHARGRLSELIQEAQGDLLCSVGRCTHLWAGFFDPLGGVAVPGLRSIANGGANQLWRVRLWRSDTASTA